MNIPFGIGRHVRTPNINQVYCFHTPSFLLRFEYLQWHSPTSLNHSIRTRPSATALIITLKYRRPRRMMNQPIRVISKLLLIRILKTLTPIRILQITFLTRTRTPRTKILITRRNTGPTTVLFDPFEDEWGGGLRVDVVDYPDWWAGDVI